MPPDYISAAAEFLVRLAAFIGHLLGGAYI